LRRRNGSLAGISHGGEDSFFQFEVALSDFVLFFFEQLFEFGYIFGDGFSHTRVLVRDDVGVSQAHHGGATGLCQSASVGEIGVDEADIPREIVVDGMVRIGVILAAVADVQS